MFICVTHVDSKTKIPGFKKPMRNGPAFPDVKGLNIEWWDQSNWPLTHPDQFPRFYGTCDDDADTSIDGVIEVLTEEGYVLAKETEEFKRLPQVVSPSQFRLALLQANVLTNVLEAIDNMDEPLKSAVKIDLEFTLEISKYSSLVKNIKTAMNWDDNTVTDLFVTASTISVDKFNNT